MATNQKSEQQGNVEEYWKIKFNNEPTDGGKEPVYLNLNGREFLAPRECEVILPKSVIENCIKNAVIDDYDEHNRFTGTIQRRPYAFIGPATKEEYLAQKKVQAEEKVA